MVDAATNRADLLVETRHDYLKYDLEGISDWTFSKVIDEQGKILHLNTSC